MDKKYGKEKGGKQRNNKNKPQRNVSEILNKNGSINKKDVDLLIREKENFDDTIKELEYKFDKLKGKKRLDLALNNRFATERLITEALSPLFQTNLERVKRLVSLNLNFSDNSLNTYQGFVDLFESLSELKKKKKI